MKEIRVTSGNGADIQNAIGQLGDEGGKVVVGPGRYYTGTIYLKSRVELFLSEGAVLEGRTKPEDYDDVLTDELEVAPEKSRKALLVACNADRIAVTGPGMINGNGVHFFNPENIQWGFYRKPDHPRPRMIEFCNCSNVRLEGITLKDCPNWTVWLTGCRQVYCGNLRVEGCQMMLNNDGIDIDGCSDVTLENCRFKTADDCIVLRAIRQKADRSAVCERVTIRNCILDSRCNGIRIGCPSDDTIRNCVIENIVFAGEGSGIAADNPLGYVRNNASLDLSNIICRNLKLDCVHSPLIIRVDEVLALRRISDIRFEDVVGKGGQPSIFRGSPRTFLDRISLKNIDLSCNDVRLFEAVNCDLRFDNCRLSAGQ